MPGYHETCGRKPCQVVVVALAQNSRNFYDLAKLSSDLQPSPESPHPSMRQVAESSDHEDEPPWDPEYLEAAGLTGVRFLHSGFVVRTPYKGS